MPTDLTNQISALTVRAPAAWLQEVWSELRSAPATATADSLKKRLPATSNSDLAHLLQQILDLAEGSMSWEALGHVMPRTSPLRQTVKIVQASAFAAVPSRLTSFFIKSGICCHGKAA